MDTNSAEWVDNDKQNPRNWSTSKKWCVTMILSVLPFCSSFASSVFSSATAAAAAEFSVSEEIMVLGSSLFVLGFALGPVIWGPLSELYGRKTPLFIGIFVSALFQIPVAVAHNVETILVCRFLGGVFGCSPMAIFGGFLADIWDSVERGVALCSFAGATFIGPLAGPIVGTFLTTSSLGWRWTEWLTLILFAVFGTIAWITVPETYAPVILSRRATRAHTPLVERRIDVRAILVIYILRPFKMLLWEPILLLLTVYLAFIYGILYLWFFSYPIAFHQERGWSERLSSLPFLAIIIGIALGCGYIVLDTSTRYARKMKKFGSVSPEERLPPMIVGAILLPVGFFWFAWTSNREIIWVPQVLAGIPTGAGVFIIFIQGLSYIIDVYLMHANSALAGNGLIRSIFGAAFPLFANALYRGLGIPWATSLLGFISLAMVPVPVLFWFYGNKIRGWSKMSVNKM
ncbi:MFS general substrate transporter [Ustulina deusta]|nr:MFS general substrate transporter [Ustulina deusta]